MIEAKAVERAVEELDVGLFESIASQSTIADRRSLLAIQRALARRSGGYTYLEIGSHLGGTIQPHYLDRRCRHIVSIDSRPSAFPDERGVDYFYPDNSTQRMLDNLERLDPESLGKLTTFDSDASEIDPVAIESKPNLALIDGEHTNPTARLDFEFCRSVCDGDAAIVFHDADIVYAAIAEICERLEAQEAPFRGVKLRDSVFCILLGAAADIADEAFGEQVEDTRGFFRRARWKLAEKRLRCRLARSPIYPPYKRLRQALWGKGRV